MEVEPLHYANASLGKRAIGGDFLRKFFATSVCIIIIAGVVAACFISIRAPWIWFGSRGAYQWHRWLTFTMPPDTVVYEEDPSRAVNLTSLPSEERGMFVGDPEKGPDRWPQDTAHDYAKVKSGAIYWPAAFQVMVRQRSQCLLFMHERVGTSGRSRFVLVKGKCVYPAYSPLQPSDMRGAVHILACSYQIGEPFGLFGGSKGQSVFSSVNVPLGVDQVMRIYAGQPDPNDDAHFTIKYEIDNVPGTIDGRLEADDTVTLKILSGPAATQPAGDKPH